MADTDAGDKEKSSFNQEKETERRITLLIILGVISLLLIVIIIGILIRNRSFL